MDLQEKHQLDRERLAGQVAHVKARARPWRSITALILAIAAATVSYEQHLSDFSEPGHATTKLITACSAAAFCLFASVTSVSLSGQVRTVMQPRVGSAHAAVIRYSILLAGTITTLVITLQLFKIPIGQLVLGGALTGVVLGLAGQQSLANLFAGIVLLMARPFVVGDNIRVRSGAMGGVLEGTVSEIGITYVRLSTPDGVFSLPNSQVLAAAVGPAPASDPEHTA
ncbi:MAG TPA: mechanosensitive ion channel family protein [Streptosporangiaceae bacterium]|jgi:small-conductance mechanosensitive channel